MTALWVDPENRAQRLERIPKSQSRHERWLQEQLFDHPELMPFDEIEHGAGGFIPIVQELRLDGNVRLDVLGVTPHGRLVLVECKLWRNPQARREVVAQLLEYAALLGRWSYADLEARLKERTGWQGENPLFAHVRDRLTEPDEARFVDAVSRSLKARDFNLIIAGDGIQEGLDAIADHLAGQGARLALVEFQLWKDATGGTLVVPQVRFRTEVVRQQLVLDLEGTRITIDDVDDVEGVEVASIDEGRTARRAFWQRFIDEVRFDHPDQAPPRHGGDNFVRIPFPPFQRGIHCWRSGNLIGMGVTFSGHMEIYDALVADADAIRTETGLPDLRFYQHGHPELKDTIGVSGLCSEIGNEDQQLAWLCDRANRLINALRPRI